MRLKYLLKILLSLALAFFISQILVQYVFFPAAPAFRPFLKQKITHLPPNLLNKANSLKINIQRIQEKLLARNPNLPPPYKKKPPPPFFTPPRIVNPTSPLRKKPDSPLPTSSPTTSPDRQIPTITSYQPNPTPTPFQRLLTPTLFQPPPTPTPEIQPGNPPSDAAARLLDLINNERQENGTHFLSFEAHLNKAAQDFADTITSCSHIGPDGSTPITRIKKAGYPGNYGGENIACQTSSYERAFQMWMGSSGHKANMLDKTWKSAGIGYARGYWVLDLGPI